MKIRSCVLGFAIAAVAGISSITTLQAQPTQPESKQSQCQRFNAAMTRFNDRFTDRKNDRDTQRALVENLIVVLNGEIKHLKSQQFSDTQIQALHQQALNPVIAIRNHMADYLSASDRGETAKAETAYNHLQLMPYKLSEVAQQFEQYCGKP